MASTTTTATPKSIATTTTTQTTVASTTTSTQTTVPPVSTSLARLDTGDVEGFEIINARLGNRSLLLALANTNALRSRGLMDVETLGDLDGMVFAWENPNPVSFWMKNTLISLDIGYFDDQGSLFSVVRMVPCTADPCPTYPSGRAVRFALEAAPGFFANIPLGESLTLGEPVALP